MPKSSKRPATCAAAGKPSKRPRADVHPVQEKLAERASKRIDGIIIATPMGTGKPRIAGKYLDQVVPKLVEDREEDVASVLTIVVATDAKHGREQAAQYGTDFPGPYHCSDLDAVLRLLKGDAHAARIMIPFASFRKMCYKKRGGTWGIWDLLEKLGRPEEVILLIDEVTEVYKPANGRLPKAIDALRAKYRKVTEATNIRVAGMSGTPELDNKAYAARAETLFGVAPKLFKFEAEEEAHLLADINPQNKVGREETVEELPSPTEPVEKLKDVATLATGNALFNDIRGGDALKKLVGEVLIQQILGDEQDGGVLFQKLASGGKAPMFKVGKDGAIGKKAVPAHEAVLIAVDSRYGAQALCDALQELQARSGTDELRPITVHDLRLGAQAKATKEAAKVPHEWLKRDVADQKAGVKAFLAAAARQNGTAIVLIDKRQALSGTNDFSKNVQRAVAIGAWKPKELDQFFWRLGRPCELKEGDLVPEVFYGVHISSPFGANLVANAKERAADKGMLTKEAKEKLAELKKAEDEDSYRKAKAVARVLAMTELPDDPALKYLECLGDAAEAFKENEYMPLIEHHEDCERKEETDEATGEVTKTVTKCCEACKCIFSKAGEDEDEDE
jgi:hypothetical protein